MSITTNGAESRVLDGLRETIARGHPYICLARTEEGQIEMMRGLGYEVLGQDGRGYTFRHDGDRGA